MISVSAKTDISLSDNDDNDDRDDSDDSDDSGNSDDSDDIIRSDSRISDQVLTI